MEKTIVKMLAAILIIVTLGGTIIYGKVSNIDNNVYKYCFTE